MASARKPIASDSPSAATPRTTGSRNSRCRAITDAIGRQTSEIPPSGRRTATAQFEGPRIITPSRTACPPMLLMRLLSARLARALEPALEALHPTAAVEQLLLARVERVAVRADLDMELGLRRPGLERVPAGARDGREHVIGMDVGLHSAARIAEATWVATLPPETTQTMEASGAAWIFRDRSAATAAAP